MMAGWTPMHDASFFGHTAVVQLLLNNGADPSIATEDGITPLSVALFNNHVSIVVILKGCNESEEERAKTAETLVKVSYKRKEFDAAIDHFEEAIRLNPTSAAMFAKRGNCFIKMKKPNACIRDCTRAIELNPDNAAAYKFRGRANR